MWNSVMEMSLHKNIGLFLLYFVFLIINQFFYVWLDFVC